jgi:putative tryptophan/tyrosine transport system substrate-binding protein
MRRREFITLLGSAAAVWPLAARAQVPLPVIGYLSLGGPEGGEAVVAAVHQGLGETGIVEGKDVTSEFRWAGDDPDRLPALAADLVQRRVAVMIALGTPVVARAAKAATTEIPIVFTLGTDPVRVGLVASLNHPGGNLTGITTMNIDLGAKWVELLHELLPAAKDFAVLVRIATGESAQILITDTQAGGRALGIRVEFLFADTEDEIDAALAGLGARMQGLIIQPDFLFLKNRAKLATLAMREKLPTLYAIRDLPAAGGLMSYGSSFLDAHRQAGVYLGRILKGEKPGDLPVQRPTKFELVINSKTAKAIGLDVPTNFLVRADEVIE